MSNYKTVFFILGVLQIILGLSMIVPIIAQFYYNQVDSGFIGSGLVSIIFGVLFFLSNLDLSLIHISEPTRQAEI